ncbi:MAG: FAD-binding oxidoreductase [Syntrophales bacterium]
MPRTDNRVDVFREIVGDANVAADQDKLKALAVDGVAPGLIVSPGTIAETSKVMAAAHGLGLAVLPTGGGTKMSLGGIPKRADVLLLTKRLSGYADYDIANLTIEVECGAKVSEVQAKLGAEGEGYFLPLDPPHSQGATIGGVVATNSNGPRRLLYGGLRDIILGNTAVLANGDIVHAGGKVMKNVASYDLTKLMIGSLGSLGLICRTTFRIYLKPESAATLFLAFASLKDADAFFHKVFPSFYYPAALELMTPATVAACREMIPLSGDYIIAIGLEGIVEAVERQIADMTEMGLKAGAQGTISLKGDGHRDFWIAYGDFTDELTKKHPDLVVLKSNFVISRGTEMMAAAEKVAQKAGFEFALACHAGSGILTTAILTGRDAGAKKEAIVTLIEEMTEAAVKNDGNLVVEKAPRFIKENVSVWGKIGADVGLARGLKEKFDPTGIINPGRYVGGI